jgi:FixJ family two-component response regulator
MPEGPTVFVIDDDPSVRVALKRLVESVGLNCETFESADSYLRAPQGHVPGCLVLDVRMPGMSGLDLQAHLARDGYCLPIIFLTAHGDVRTSVRAMKAGAVEFLTKPFHEQELLEAIQHAIERDREEWPKYDDRIRHTRQYNALTPRERQILERVVAGLLNKQIASELNVSESTVKLHRAEVMRKMDARSVAELVAIVSEIERG